MKKFINKYRVFDKIQERILGYRASDEMQEKVLGRACIVCTIVTVIYLLIEATYKCIMTKDILNSTWEIALVIIIFIILKLGTKNQKEMNLPKSILGNTLPTEKTISARIKRMIAYVFDSILFAAISVFFSYILDSTNTNYLIFEAISSFMISLVIDYKIGEKRCKKYEEWEESLDLEEE